MSDTPNSPLSDAVKVGHREGLEALRDRLAVEIEDTDRPPHTTAPLARQLAAVLKALGELPSPETESTLIGNLRRRHDMRIAALESPTPKSDEKG